MTYSDQSSDRAEPLMDANRFCTHCGAALQVSSSYCQRCGAAASPLAPSQTAPPTYVVRRESRAERRAARRQGPRSGYGGLVVATIFVVLGLGVFFPELPWYMFWGCLWILLGAWIAVAWTQRGRGYSKQVQSVPMNG